MPWHLASDRCIRDAQVQTLVQLLVHLLDGGLDVEEAIERPRWRCEKDGTLLIEPRFPERVLVGLTAPGHRLRRAADWEPRTGGAQVIRLDHEHRVLHGGADPRREGYALGW